MRTGGTARTLRGLILAGIVLSIITAVMVEKLFEIKYNYTKLHDRVNRIERAILDK